MNFARRASAQTYQANLEAFFRMGLKAQNQCRMTLETLATIKNPLRPPAFERSCLTESANAGVNTCDTPVSQDFYRCGEGEGW
jgi:hypothetical protein